jgi:hypothetical protein
MIDGSGVTFLAPVAGLDTRWRAVLDDVESAILRRFGDSWHLRFQLTEPRAVVEVQSFDGSVEPEVARQWLHTAIGAGLPGHWLVIDQTAVHGGPTFLALPSWSVRRFGWALDPGDGHVVVRVVTRSAQYKLDLPPVGSEEAAEAAAHALWAHGPALGPADTWAGQG